MAAKTNGEVTNEPGKGYTDAQRNAVDALISGSTADEEQGILGSASQYKPRDLKVPETNIFYSELSNNDQYRVNLAAMQRLQSPIVQDELKNYIAEKSNVRETDKITTGQAFQQYMDIMRHQLANNVSHMPQLQEGVKIEETDLEAQRAIFRTVRQQVNAEMSTGRSEDIDATLKQGLHSLNLEEKVVIPAGKTIDQMDFGTDITVKPPLEQTPAVIPALQPKLEGSTYQPTQEEIRLSGQSQRIDDFLAAKVRGGKLNHHCGVSDNITASNTYEADRLTEAVQLDSCIADLKDQLTGQGIDSSLIDSKLNPHVMPLEDIAPNIKDKPRTEDIVPGFTKR